MHGAVCPLAKMMSTREGLEMPQNTIEGGLGHLSTTPSSCGLSKLSCGTYVCHNVGERRGTSVFF